MVSVHSICGLCVIVLFLTEFLAGLCVLGFPQLTNCDVFRALRRCLNPIHIMVGNWFLLWVTGVALMGLMNDAGGYDSFEEKISTP